MVCGGYQYRERCGKIILVVNIILLLCGTVCLTGLLTWDLTSGVQTVTGRCVWAGYCIWVSALLSLLVCIFFLLVNLLAFSGITRSSSWSNTFPSTSYRMLYPWLLSYFILNTSILPAGILLVYEWYEGCSTPVCQRDILHSWAPIIGVTTLLLLLVLLHNWFLLLTITKNLWSKMNPQPFTRIGSRVVLGLLDTSHGDAGGGSSTLSKGSTLVSYVYP